MQVELRRLKFIAKLASVFIFILIFSIPFSTIAHSSTKLDSKMYGIKTRLDALQTQLGGVRDKVSATRAELDRLQAELGHKQKELKAALKELKRLSAILNKRAGNYYKSGRVSYLEVILSAKSFSDLIHQVDYLSTVVDQDAKFVREIKDTRATIEAAKATIEKNKTVTIDVSHGGGWVTRYAHLRRVIVTGGAVAQGQQIADSGGAAGDPGAGSSSTAHLHFELRDDGGGYGFSGTVNPLDYLP